MNARIAMAAVWISLLTLLAAGPALASSVWRLDVDGAIGPATAEYVREGIEDADAADVQAVVLRMDTPGGLDSAMRTIVQAVLAARTPVITWVAPSGARAASAGTYILYASHIAAMAPATNLGAATPVRMGGGLPGGGDDTGDGKSGAGNEEAQRDPMHRKMVNDAVAYIRGLAALRGRDADWAEKAVRGAASLPAQAARERGVIDLVAADVSALLAGVDGRTVKTQAGEEVLATRGAEVVERAPDWRTRLLAVIAHPNVAYILMLVGIYGLIFELASPGAVVPGVVGGVALLLALFALQVLTVSYAGVGLLLFGIALMFAEAFAPSFGMLGLGGMVAFVIGSLMLFDMDAPGFQLSVWLVVGVSLASVVLLLGAGLLAARAYRRPVVSADQRLAGARARVISGFPGSGWVQVLGERWQADCPEELIAGEVVEVVAADGLRLTVRRPAKPMWRNDSQ